MKWKDFFYFSKGERQALTLLLSLIAITWLAIFYTDYTRLKNQKEPIAHTHKPDTIRVFSTKETKDTSKVQPKKSETPAKNKIAHSFRTPKSIRSTRGTVASTFQKTEKFPKGTVLELNAADTIALKKIPGIGSVFAKRIIKYRKLLGGFYSVEQLGEVYGIDEDKYESLRTWFTVEPALIDSLPVNQLSVKELASHPYITYKQAKSIKNLERKRGKIRDWNDLILLEEFPEFDQSRLIHYLSFK